MLKVDWLTLEVIFQSFSNFVHIAHIYNNFGLHSLAGYMWTTTKLEQNNEIGTHHE